MEQNYLLGKKGVQINANGCNCVEFKENDGKVERKYFIFYLSFTFPSKFILSRRIKSTF